MNKIFTPIVITTAATFIVSCGSENNSSDANASSQKTTWRLSSLDVSYIQNNETIVQEDAVFYEYDSNNELVRIKEQGSQPFTGDLTGQELTYNREDLTSDAPTSSEFQWPPSEEYQFITEITSISPSHWIEEHFRVSMGITEEEVDDVTLLRSSIEFLDWGDTVYQWGNISDDWAGTSSNNSSESYSFDEFVDLPLDTDSTFWFPSANSDLASYSNLDRENSSLPQLESHTDFEIPKQYVIREYNNLGYLTYRAIYTEDQSQLISEDILEYHDGVTLEKLTTHKTLTTTSLANARPIYTSYSAETATEIRRFTFIAENVLQIEVLAEFNGELQTYSIETANYEQAPCGPMTSERSKKAIPRAFPVCIEK